VEAEPTSPTWILLRGLTRERRHWGAFPETLASATGAPAVLAIDLPGNGELNAQRSPRSIEAMAMQCRQQLRERGVSAPYRVLAMSMGAMVATAWAARFSDEIDAAVLINTSMRPFSRLHQRLRPRNYASMLRVALMSPGAQTLERAVLRMTSHHHHLDAQVVADWAEFRRDRPVSRANALAQLWAAARFTAPIRRPFERVLLLTSAHDSLVDTRCSIAMTEAWHCELASHPTAGHDLPLDAPEWVAQKAADFIRASSVCHDPITAPADDACS
jgi:pimeloyl-ACP methyl ester carboxylesterase